MKSRKEQIRGQIFFTRLAEKQVEIIGLSNLGKLQFHRKVEERIQKAKRIKPFHRRINNRNHYLFMKLKQFERENWNESSSEQEHKVNALAQGADEGRDKLR